MGGRFLFSAKAIATGGALVMASPALADDVYPQDVAEQATKLQPISAWNLDYGEASCRLTRMFESDGKDHIFAIEQHAPDRSFRIIVAGSELTDWNKNRRFELGLRSDAPLKKVESFSSGQHSKFGTMLVLRSSLEDQYLEKDELRKVGIDLNLAGNVDRVVLQSKRGLLSYETGEMRPVFEAWNACTRDLIARWGLDEEAHALYAPPYYRDSSKFLSRFWNALPRQTFRSMAEGQYAWRLLIEKDGKISDCKPLIDQGSEEDRGTKCKALTSLRFEPARNSSGTPMRSYFILNVSMGPSL